MKLYVNNLPSGMSDADLENLFRPFGVVASARIVIASRGEHFPKAGLVEMQRKNGDVAVSELDGKQIDCMVLQVHEMRV